MPRDPPVTSAVRPFKEKRVDVSIEYLSQIVLLVMESYLTTDHF